jgi:hypothetical protein
MEKSGSEIKIKTLHPSWEKFRDFEGYIEQIEKEGASEAGIVRVSI